MLLDELRPRLFIRWERKPREEGRFVAQQREKCETSRFSRRNASDASSSAIEGTNTTTISSGILKFSKANTHRVVTKMYWPNNKFRIATRSVKFLLYISRNLSFIPFLLLFAIINFFLFARI